MAGELGVGALATTLLSPLATLAQLFGFYRKGLARCQPAGHFVNAQIAVFTFVHCAASKQDAIESRAGEAALWFVNAAPRVFNVPRSVWITQIRGAAAARTTPRRPRAARAPTATPTTTRTIPSP